MPLYDFQCRACGRFEASRPMKQAAAPLRCPTCQRRAPRILSAVAIGHGARAPVSEPRRVVRGESREPTPPSRAHASHGRPWMMGH
ncbi:MAG TPA: zinc ribbon domain-containing protein [Polyangia bacterium]